ncbi:MAG: Rrf2 family transcriptional regulator [Chloroflexi bacterium]|nr:Rrf2 family transcriptional regulator [Chloroflexota bacterium]
MNTSQRFAITIHALTLLADSRQPLTSEYIAGSVDTHAVVIRRTMAALREQGLVESKPGARGGWKLKRAPGKIHLREVYQSLGEEEVLSMHSHPNRYCPIGGNIRGVLEEVFSSAQSALLDSLSRRTIADVLRDVHARARRR